MGASKTTEAGEPPRRRAFALPRLGPYLWDAHLARALCRACAAGSRRIITLAWRWTRHAPPGDRLLRTGILSGALYIAAWAAAHQPHRDPRTVAAELLGAATGWAAAAVYLAGSTPWAAPKDMADPAPEEGVPVQPPLDADTVARAVRQIAAPQGWRGAHLDDILAHLPGHSREELLGVLAGAGIPITEQLKLTLPGGRQRNRQGVRLTALPAGLGEAPLAPASAPAGPPAEGAPEPLPDPPRGTVHGAQQDR
jgi:hypothetical protein